MASREHGFSPYRHAFEQVVQALGSRSNGRGETGRASVTLKEVKIGTGADAKLELQIEVTCSAIDLEGVETGPFDEGTAAFRAGQEAQAEYDRLRALYPTNGTAKAGG